MTSLYSTCRPLLQAARADQPDRAVPVWDFEFRGWPWSAAWRAFPALQESLVKAFLAQGPECYLQMNPSDVLDWPESSGWARPFNDTFELPAGVDAAALTKSVLYLGGYRLYCAPAPVEPSLLSVDPWRTAPAELVALMASLGISALIAALHDDESWRIIFPSEASAMSES